MGEVWLADDTRLSRQVALKTVRAADGVDTAGRERLLREARAAAALKHEGIAPVYDVLEADGQVVIVFEYVEGESLQARLKRGPLPLDTALDFGVQLCEALESAHARGVVHRDLKPGNIMVGPNGRLKVLDFGVARVVPTGTTTTPGGTQETVSRVVGTPGYAAPEQWVSPHVDARADLFALGVVLFEMVAGHRPFPGNDPIALAESLFSRQAPRLRAAVPSAPRALDDLVARLLDRDRERRPGSARGVLEALRSVKTGRRVPPLPPRPSPRLLTATAALMVAIVALVGWLISREPVEPAMDAPPVVAVLPLNNLSGDASREYIAAGVADSLITSLVGLPSVIVLSRAAVAEARTRNPDMRALATELGATFMVEGSVQQAGDRLRISLTLVRAIDRAVAWAETVEGTFAQVLDLQRRLAMSLTNALSVRLSASERERLARPATASPEALDAYWRGRAFLDRRDVKGSLDAAIQAFERAVQIDARFALAHAALGECYWQNYLETRNASWMERAVTAGNTALRLDPDQPEVRYTLAITLAGSGRADEAVEELTRALVLQPNYDDARRRLGRVLADQGRIEEAVAEFRKAIDLRPGVAAHFAEMGIALFNAAKYPEAADAFRRMTELQPDNYSGYQLLGATYQSLGEHDRALEYYARAIEIRPNPQTYSNIGAIHHVRGEYEQAVAAYEKALELRPNSHQTWRNLGDAYRRLERRPQAMQAYGRAIDLAAAAVKVNPSDAVGLALLAVYLAKTGQDDEARDALERAEALAPADVRVLSRAAVVHALGGRPEPAIRALTDAVARGYSRSLIAEDDDFESLHGVAEFQALLAPQAKE
jgi:tetratricopeptide (TPR) repeat protein